MHAALLRSSVAVAALAIATGAALLGLGIAFDREAPAAAQGPAARKPVSACTLAISDTLVSSPVTPCEPAAVTVTLGLTCPVELPMRVVFVIGRHLLMEDHLDEVKSAARSIASSLPFDVPGTKAGVVSVSTQERVEQELTDSQSSVTGAIGAIRLDRVDPTMRYFDWLGRAQDMLEEERRRADSPALEAIVLFSTGCPTGFDSYCERQVGAANRAKGADITVAGVCHPDATPFGLITIPGDHCKYIRNISSGGYYHDLDQARRVESDLAELMETVETLTPGEVELREVLSAGLSMLPGGGLPAPRVVDGAHVFAWTGVGRGDVLTATYRISTSVPGTVPLRPAAAASVAILDSMGRAREVPLVSPDLVVEPCPTATPTATPTDTPEPTSPPTDTPEASPTPEATSTPEPSPTPRPGRIWLPVALRGACMPASRPLLVALAIDTSSSMDERSGGGSETKLDAAKAAAIAFVDVLQGLGRGDRAGVVAFDARARVAVDMTADSVRLRAGIEALATGDGTRIDEGLRTSLAMLAAALDGAVGPVRVDTVPVVVLLSDGRPDEGTADAALAVAAEARGAGAGAGVKIHTIGLGDDVDEAILRAIATTPEDYLAAPDPAALHAIYRELARDLPCPGGVLWRR